MSQLLTDIAFAPNGDLFGVTLTQLYRVNVATAALTLVGNLGVNDQVTSLVFAADGTLYAAGSAGELYTVNSSTGAATPVGAIGFAAAGDLAFDSTGQLYMSSTTDQLVRVDRATGAGTAVGPLGFSDVLGLAFGDNGVMYGLAGTQVFSINLATGAGTLVTDYAGKGLSQAYGSSFFHEARPVCTPPPCPTDSALVCPGICPGGCGVVCKTITPATTPTQTFTPTPNGCAAHPGAVFCDNFDDNTIDSSHWVRRIIGAGDIDIRETNGRLEANLGPNITASAGGGFGAFYESRCQLQGDFDIEVSFDLLQWPTASGVRVGFVLSTPDTSEDTIAGPGSVTLSRSALGDGEYFIYFNPDPEAAFRSVFPVTDSSGRLRLVRSNDRITGYYLNGGSWIPLGPGSAAPADRMNMYFGIRSISADFSHQPATVALDDFVVNQGTLVCPEAPIMCSQVLLDDNFDGSTLDPARWNLLTAGYPEPAYSVANGFVYVGRNISTTSFPVISTAANPFPATEDFSVEVAMQYASVTGYGDGLWLSGPNGEVLWRIWQDTMTGGVNVSLNEHAPYVVNPNLSLHRYRFEFVRNIATVYVDDVPVLSQPLAVRPSKLAFGNGATGLPAGPWTLFQIDSIRVSGACTSQPALLDDFEDGTINPSLWVAQVDGSGPAVSETNHHVEMVLPQNSNGATFGGFLALSNCRVSGDFDAQVDYELLEWPSGSGARLGLTGRPLSPQESFLEGVDAERTSFGNNDNNEFPRDAYDTFARGYLYTGFTPTDDRSGTLRLARIGDTITAYHLAGNMWIPTGLFAPASGDFTFSIGSWSYTPAFTGQETRVAFDNFIINRGLLDCSPHPTATPHVPCTGNGTERHGALCADETWSVAESPIRVTQTVSVGGGCPPGAAPTLTIEPDVEVCFSDNAALNVSTGTLFARGTEQEPILFTSSDASPAPGAWDGIRFENGSADATFDANGHFTGGSILEQAIVRYAKDSDGRGVVSAKQSLPFLSEITVRDSAAGTAVVGLDVQDKNQTIRLRSLRVVDNSGRGSTNGPGVRVWPKTLANILGAAVLSNAGDGLFTDGYSFSSNDNPVLMLSASAIASNGGHGVRCRGRCDLSSVHSSYNGGDGFRSEYYPTGSIQDGTLFFNGGTGLYLSSSNSSASTSNWMVSRNEVVGNRTAGIGLSTVNAVIRNNCIEGNTRNPQSSTQGRAIRVSGQATIEQNTVVGNDASAIWVITPQNVPISQNNFEGNGAPILEYGAPSSAPTLQAANNWWGGTNSTDVSYLVYDHNDDVSRGYVNFDQPSLASAPIADAPMTGPCARCVSEVPADHWKGEYWNTTAIYDAPATLGEPRMVRDDGTGFLNFDWGNSSPDLACGIGTDVFSVRWTRNINFPQAGTYRFTVATDDTFRLVIDGTVYLDVGGGSVRTYTVDVPLSADTHLVRAEYTEVYAAAVAKLSWTLLNLPTPTVTPTASLTFTPLPSSTFTPSGTFTRTATATPTRTATITGTRPTALMTPTAAPTPTGGICAQPKIDLAILIDSSGSIDPSDFELEKEGFARAFEDPSKVPQDGSACVTVIEFSSQPTLYLQLPAGCITDSAAATRIAAEIRNVAYTGGATGIDSAIAAAAAQFSANARPDARQVVLLATDGILNACDSGVRPLPLCPPPPACGGLDSSLAGARPTGADEFDVIAIEDPGDAGRAALTRDDFTNFYGCRVFPQPNSPGPPPQPGFVISVGHDFHEFARVVTSTLPSLSCATRVDLNDTTGQPGGTSRVNATLTKAPGIQVALAGSDITFDPTLVQADCSACTINPSIGSGTAANKNLRCARTDIDAHTSRLRVDVFATDNANPIPDGRLFTCEVNPVGTLARGTVIPLYNQPSTVAPDSTLIATLGRDGSITVSGCPGDCDDNGEVGLDEVGRAVLLFLGIPPSAPCPAADLNGDGQVSIGEVVQVVDARFAGCGR